MCASRCSVCIQGMLLIAWFCGKSCTYLHGVRTTAHTKRRVPRSALEGSAQAMVTLLLALLRRTALILAAAAQSRGPLRSGSAGTMTWPAW